MPTDNDEELYDCYNCGDQYEQSDMCTSEYDGYLRCEGCHDSHIEDNSEPESDSADRINYHDYKPRPVFFSDDGSYYSNPMGMPVDGMYRPNPHFGVELEVEAMRGDRYEGVDIAERFNEGLFYLKEDGSLGNGFEIVTHPMSLGYVQNHATQLWRAMDGLRRAGFRAWKTSTCGLHIHISKKSFHNDAHQQKFVYFIYHKDNTDSLVKFAGRNSHWSKFRKDLYLGHDENSEPFEVEREVTILEAIKGVRKDGSRAPQSWDRYLAVNSRNTATHELRFFRPSLQPHALRACVEFCAALFDYTATVTASDCIKNHALDFGSFAAWARTNADKYPDFVPRMDKRVYGCTPQAEEDDGNADDIQHNA